MASVLIVEDDPAITEVLADLLGAEGWAVRTAADGAAGLAALAAELPDLVLLDVMMPALTGPEMLRFARAAGYAGRAVVMSAAPPPELDGLDVAAFVSKPFDVDEIVALVERLIGTARAAG